MVNPGVMKRVGVPDVPIDMGDPEGVELLLHHRIEVDHLELLHEVRARRS